MSLSSILLALFILLQSLSLTGLYGASAKIIGIVGLAYIAVWLLELAGVLTLAIRSPR